MAPSIGGHFFLRRRDAVSVLPQAGRAENGLVPRA
jgi:hypothetical protein